MAEKLTNYDPAEDLGSDESIAIFMAEAFETNDVGYISHALGVVARVEKVNPTPENDVGATLPQPDDP